ncbi:Uncharacterised protein [Mycobacteroides abscessus subsp. abscessus]|nr:Uncharacterised protein [Mycobacteroides abscessus subsp. abscessus]
MPTTLVFSIACHCARSAPSMPPNTSSLAATLTRASTAPNLSTAVSTRRWHAVASVMSVTAQAAEPPVSSSSVVSLSRFSRVRAPSTTFAPS